MNRVLIILWVAAVFGYAGFAIIQRIRKRDSFRQVGSDGAASPHGESRRCDDLAALDGDGGNGGDGGGGDGGGGDGGGGD